MLNQYVVDKPLCDAGIDTKLAHSEEHRIRLMEAQARFEQATVDEGVELYREFASQADALELTAGKRLMKLLRTAKRSPIRRQLTIGR